MKKVLKLALVAVMVLSSTTLFAQKLGRINTQEVLMAMPETKEAQTKLEASAKEWQENIEAAQVEFNNKFAEYQKNMNTMSDGVRQVKEKELQDKAANFQTSAQKEIKELDEEGVVFQNRMNDLIMRAVQAINADKQYKMIVQASALLDADESLNLTEQVLAKVNELYAEEKSEKSKK